MKLLAVDTTANGLELALAENDEVIGYFHGRTGTRTTRVLHNTLSALLDAAGLTLERLDLIVVVRGPGSFTGLRIGLAVAKTISQVLGTPAMGLSTLELLAARVQGQEGSRLHTAVNTFRDDVYVQSFRREADNWRAEGEIQQQSFSHLWELAGDEPILMRRVPQRHQVPIAPPTGTRLLDMALGEHLVLDALRTGHAAFRSGVAATIKHRLDPIYIKPEVTSATADRG